MYIPEHFEESRPEILKALVAQHPLGVLITCGSDGLDANHLPFEWATAVDGSDLLRAHVARSNPVWRNVRNGDDVLVVFRAGDAYISPNWYPSKHETHRLVPTWNYRVVHAHGRISIHDDEKTVRGIVARLTRQHESTEVIPWKMTDAPPEHVDALLKAIVGIEIQVVRLQGKFKLSQNREARDRLHAAQTLIDRGESDLGQAMLDAR